MATEMLMSTFVDDKGSLGSAKRLGESVRNERTEAVPGSTLELNVPAYNTIYDCGEMDEITIEALPESPGDFVLRFNSGYPETQLILPDAVLLPDDFEIKSAAHYEISVSVRYEQDLKMYLGYGAFQWWDLSEVIGVE